MADQMLALRNFVHNNADLEKIEQILQEFNFFDVLGVSSRENTHSHFLAWLMHPTKIHGIKNDFLLSFLKVAISHSPHYDKNVSLEELENWDMSSATVQREWNKIDIFIEDQRNHFICVIENKIFSKDHSKQLSKYRKFVECNFKEYNKLFVYLTPDGSEPVEESESQYYASVSYDEVYDILIELQKNRGEFLMNDVQLVLDHYIKTIGRVVMNNSELQVLAQKIYKEHREALDIIFEHRMTDHQQIQNYLKELVDNQKGLQFDRQTGQLVNFSSDFLDKTPLRHSGVTKKWTKSTRTVLFEFQNRGEKILLCLFLGPGQDHLRIPVYEYAKKHPPLFNCRTSFDSKNQLKLDKKDFICLYQKEIVSKEKYLHWDLDDIKGEISKMFDEFLQDDLPKFQKAFEEIEFVIEGIVE